VRCRQLKSLRLNVARAAVVHAVVHAEAGTPEIVAARVDEAAVIVRAAVVVVVRAVVAGMDVGALTTTNPSVIHGASGSLPDASFLVE
jgi:hypothetical protein